MPHKVTHATPYAVHIDMVAYRSAASGGVSYWPDFIVRGYALRKALKALRRVAFFSCVRGIIGS